LFMGWRVEGETSGRVTTLVRYADYHRTVVGYHTLPENFTRNP
jgi:hypothetical protein